MKRFAVQTFGCQMNVHDSERIEDVLRAEGYEATDEVTLADLVLVNTCSVREKAEHKLMSLLGRLAPLKHARPGVVLAVAGCVAQQEGDRLLRRAPYVDLVLGPDNIPELPTLLRAIEGGSPPIARTVFDLDQPDFLAPRRRESEGAGVTSRSEVGDPGGVGPGDEAPVSAFATVMKGCDERCTYCVVPNTRGPERYRSANAIVAEVVEQVAAGAREITLLGQTVNSWYDPTELDARPRGKLAPSRSRFADLLRRITAEAPALARLRYTSPHPRHLTPELIAAHRDLAVLPAHVHLPAQSGSDVVLRRMARRYTRAEYVERVSALRIARPGLTLSTDLIVGFPGETEEDFRATLDFVREVGFVAAFCFKYSPRPSTPALALGDDVPEEEKEARLARLFEIVDAQQLAHLETLVGAREQVLVEGPSRTARERFTGRSSRHEIVHVDVPSGTDPTGLLLDVVVEEANRHSLRARLAAGVTIPPRPASPRRRVALPLAQEAAG